MDGAIHLRAPQAHCYLCGETDISGVCHHCARLICSQHLPTQPRRLFRLVGKWLARLGFIGHLPDERNVHCRDCRHDLPLELLVLTLMLVLLYTVVGIGLIAQGNAWAVIVVALGLLLVLTIRFVVPRSYRGEASHSGEPIYLAPRIDKRLVTELVRGNIQLDEKGEYTVDGISATGRRLIELSFGETDRLRVERFLQQHSHSDPETAVYRAGFAVSKGQVGAWPETIELAPKRLLDPLVPLSGVVASISKLTGAAGYEAGEHTFASRYRAFWPLEAKAFPVQIFPALHPETGRQALDLTIQWTGQFQYRPQVQAYQIVYLSLHYPVAWGKVIASSDPLVPPQDPDPPGTGDEPRQRRFIQGPNGETPEVPLPEDDQVERYMVNWVWLPLTALERKRRQRSVYVKFERTITPEAGVIYGLVHVGFHGTFSGMTGIEVFQPTGGKSQQPEATEVDLVVDAEYTMRLDNLRQQEICVFQEDESHPATFTVRGLPPTAETVMSLTGALSQDDQKFYVRWTVENPPHTGDSANVVNRYWDMGGRYYEGVYPIDFHLVLTGSEIQETGSGTIQGDTTVALTVQGAFSSDQMRLKIENVWKRLYDLVHHTLDEMVLHPLDEEA